MRREKELRNWELVNFCEFDKYAIKSYCAIHGVDESLNLGDITKVNETKLEDFNMMTWGFPCTDISVAGKQKGFLDEDGNKTRSGMYYEGIRILRHKKPALSIIENVKNLTSKRFKKEFETVLSDLDEAGYNSYWKVLNAKDFGIPQNRERVFIISIRKDLDNGRFTFPEGFDNGIRLKDILEDEVDEKYYISDDKVQRFLTNLNTNTSLLYDPCQVKREGKSREYNDYCPTLTSRDYKDSRLVNENVVKQVGNISDCNGNWKNPQVGRIYDPDGCSPTLNTCGKGSHEPKIVQVGNVNPSGKGMNGNVFSEDGLAPTLTTNKGEGNKILTGIRIRKLTPKKTFRLMGFSDSAYDAASKVVSNSQLYKQSGNSIVVDILYYILVELYKAMPYLFDDLKLSSFFSGIGAFEASLDRLYESINTGNFTKPQVE
ncbi:DNA (cytosine-5-)-methyltransferase [Romboutsia ilealis]|uniref:DNA (cytosine-5-)-methyltransferase n=1 Tax=Romboutsia ilealis TaxID=1115758 RepID=UPI0026F3BB13|nr:DNA (cytosine-5-)-methyltransferase [Romboutsia ilealis]